MHSLKSHAMAALLALAVALPCLGAGPVATLPMPGQSVVASGLSNDGLWLTTCDVSVTDGDLRSPGGMLFNTADPSEHYVITHKSGLASTADVTDGGTVVVGSCADRPAYWTRATGTWTELPVPDGYTSGSLTAVTPDGRWAVGNVSPAADIFQSTGLLYDLKAGTYRVLPGLPALDQQLEDNRQLYLTAISADGRYLLGDISRSYIMPVGMYEFVYDTTADDYTIIGFNRTAGRPASRVQGMLFTEQGVMSPDGKTVVGHAYLAKEVPGSDFANEYKVGYRYDVPTGGFELFDGAGDNDVCCFAVADDGTPLGACPATNPWSDGMVHAGRYWYSIDRALAEAYGYDLTGATGLEVSGKPVLTSADGLTLIMHSGQYDSYILRLHQPLAVAAASVDLLGQYRAEPAAGSVFSAVSTVKVAFDRPIAMAGLYSQIRLTDAAGNTLRQALQATVEGGNTLTIGFRTYTLAEGAEYRVEIPAGMVSVDGDQKVANRAITIPYTGRVAGAVAPVTVYPEAGSSLPRLDGDNNYISLQYNATLKVADGARARLLADGSPLCDLLVAVQGQMMAVYPATLQYLYEGTAYTVEIPAGTVTDLSGQGACEALSLDYRGSYVRQVSSDDRTLFSDDCSTYANMMFFDGDRLAPGAVAASWNFTADNPWLQVRESNESTDNAFAAHSMFAGSGTADDWMCTPQLHIPDDRCTLAFDAQSYLEAGDRLHVYIYECDRNINTLNAATVAEIRAGGRLAFDRELHPGAETEMFTGDWEHFNVPLAEYAGKNIYIAFVNENTDKSAVIVDNIIVSHDVALLMTDLTRATVVARDGVTVKGIITVTAPGATYDSVSLTLSDAEGNAVDIFTASGLTLGTGMTLPFEFARQLPLETGRAAKYTVRGTVGTDPVSMRGTVKNLTFQPLKRVVLEEYTGSDCPNCPLGVLAIENLEHTYPDNFIAIGVRTYSGDFLGTGVTAYGSFLGLNEYGAPSGRINRRPGSFPMMSTSSDYLYSSAAVPDQPGLWMDEVRDELAAGTDAAIEITTSYDAATGEVTAECAVRPAIDIEGANYSLFGVILEDNLETYQSNNLGSLNLPVLGDWGKGGRYSASTVYPYVARDVARGTMGASFNGTMGLLPSSMTASGTYTATLSAPLPSSVEPSKLADVRVAVMLIDANTERVVNANVASLGSAGVTTTEADAAVSIAISHGVLTAKAAGTVSGTVHTLSGMLLGILEGDSEASLDLGNYRGVAIAVINGQPYKIAM